MIPSKPFYFMRHAGTEWNRLGLITGSQDIPMNKEGIFQVQGLLEALSILPFDSIISSPLQRALSMAQLIGQKVNIKVKVVSNLKSCAWGKKEGKPNDDHWYEQWKSGELVIAGAENYEDFLKRTIDGFKEALEEPGVPLIIGHGGMHSILQHNLGLKTQHVGNSKLFFHIPPSMQQDFWKLKAVRL